MWQAFVPASGPESGEEGRYSSSKKRQRPESLPGDGQAVSSLYESIVRPGVPHSCASNAGPNLEENNSNSNGDFNDNFNVSDAYHGCNNFADGGNDKSNDNGNQNGKGGSGARRLRTGRAQALPTAAEKEGLQEEAEEEEECTAVGLAGTATFGPAPNPNRTREYGPSNREEQEGGERGGGGEGFFCGVCGERVKSLSEEKHNTSTLHIFNQQHRPADRKVQIDESNRGFQLLESMGWNLDEGLGARKQGRVNPLKTTFRQGKTGLGAGEKLRARVTHFPSHVPAQALNAPDGKSDAVRAHESLDRRRRRGGGGGGGGGGGLGGWGGGGGASQYPSPASSNDSAAPGARGGGFWGQGVQQSGSGGYGGGGSNDIISGGGQGCTAAAASRKQRQPGGGSRSGSEYFMSRKERKARDDREKRKERKTKFELFSDVPEEYAALFDG